MESGSSPKPGPQGLDHEVVSDYKQGAFGELFGHQSSTHLTVTVHFTVANPTEVESTLIRNTFRSCLERSVHRDRSVHIVVDTGKPRVKMMPSEIRLPDVYYVLQGWKHPDAHGQMVSLFKDAVHKLGREVFETAPEAGVVDPRPHTVVLPKTYKSGPLPNLEDLMKELAQWTYNNVGAEQYVLRHLTFEWGGGGCVDWRYEFRAIVFPIWTKITVPAQEAAPQVEPLTPQNIKDALDDIRDLVGQRLAGAEVHITGGHFEDRAEFVLAVPSTGTQEETVQCAVDALLAQIRKHWTPGYESSRIHLGDILAGDVAPLAPQGFTIGIALFWKRLPCEPAPQVEVTFPEKPKEGDWAKTEAAFLRNLVAGELFGTYNITSAIHLDAWKKRPSLACYRYPCGKGHTSGEAPGVIVRELAKQIAEHGPSIAHVLLGELTIKRDVYPDGSESIYFTLRWLCGTAPRSKPPSPTNISVRQFIQMLDAPKTHPGLKARYSQELRKAVQQRGVLVFDAHPHPDVTQIGHRVVAEASVSDGESPDFRKLIDKLADTIVKEVQYFRLVLQDFNYKWWELPQGTYNYAFSVRVFPVSDHLVQKPVENLQSPRDIKAVLYLIRQRVADKFKDPKVYVTGGFLENVAHVNLTVTSSDTLDELLTRATEVLFKEISNLWRQNSAVIRLGDIDIGEALYLPGSPPSGFKVPINLYWAVGDPPEEDDDEDKVDARDEDLFLTTLQTLSRQTDEILHETVDLLKERYPGPIEFRTLHRPAKVGTSVWIYVERLLLHPERHSLNRQKLVESLASRIGTTWMEAVSCPPTITVGNPAVAWEKKPETGEYEVVLTAYSPEIPQLSSSGGS